MSAPRVKPPTPQEKVENIEKIKEEATNESLREKQKMIASNGRQGTLIAGIANSLKKRLGE